MVIKNLDLDPEPDSPKSLDQDLDLDSMNLDLKTLRVQFLPFLFFNSMSILNCHRGVAERRLLSWLSNSALVYEPKCGGDLGGGGVSANEYSCSHEPK